MNRAELERLSKSELVDLVLQLQLPAKTSRTSSRPPSSDRKEKREGSKPGGAKPGHKGHFRMLADDPDQVTEHRPERCSGCGHVFAAAAAGETIGAYDAVDLPAITPVVMRHLRLACVCAHCGARTKAALPVAASGSPFGPNIQTLAFYLKHQQHLSYQRLDDVFRLWRAIGDAAVSTIKRKRRDLEDRIGAILCAHSNCDVWSGVQNCL